MTFILRWLLILILLAFVALMLAGGPLLGLVQSQLQDDLSVWADGCAKIAKNADWIETALWFAAAAFFAIAIVRLMRRTQAFWMWLLGFACFGARWALSMRGEEGGVVGWLHTLTPSRFLPPSLAGDAHVLGLVLMAKLLAIGLILLAVDNADRTYWDRHAA